MEVLIRNVVWKYFSKRVRKTPCLLETSEHIVFVDMKDMYVVFSIIHERLFTPIERYVIKTKKQFCKRTTAVLDHIL